MIEIVVLIECLLGFACFGVMDELQHHFFDIKISFIKRNPQFWDPVISWKNKYQYPDITKEKFWGSTTWFVFLTDGWHMMQSFGYLLLSIGLTTLVIYYKEWAIELLLVLPLGVYSILTYIKSLVMKMI